MSIAEIHSWDGYYALCFQHFGIKGDWRTSCQLVLKGKLCTSEGLYHKIQAHASKSKATTCLWSWSTPKMEVLYLIRLFLGVGFPLHRPYPYSIYRWGFLHFRYLKFLMTVCLNTDDLDPPIQTNPQSLFKKSDELFAIWLWWKMIWFFQTRWNILVTPPTKWPNCLGKK